MPIINWTEEKTITSSQETFPQSGSVAILAVLGFRENKFGPGWRKGWAEVGRRCNSTTMSDCEPAAAPCIPLTFHQRIGAFSIRHSSFCANDGWESFIPFWSAPTSQLPNRGGTALPQIRRLGKTRQCCLLHSAGSFIYLANKKKKKNRTKSANGHSSAAC